MTDLQTLQKYENWKSAKKFRTRWIKFLANLIGFGLGIVITWLILKVSPKDNWTLTKATFASEDKILEHVEKINPIEEKLKKSIVKKPLNWLSKKIEEDAAKEVLKGNLGAVVSAIRTYAIILIVIWVIMWGLIWTILYFLSYWIIRSFIWKEPKLTEEGSYI